MSKSSSYPIDRIFAFKFSRSPYFDNHLSENIHTCTIDTLQGLLSFDVCLFTIKYVATVQYLSISFLYIHALRLSHFSQLKRLQSSYAVMRQLLLGFHISKPVFWVSNDV